MQQLHSQVSELKGVVNSHSEAEARFAMERSALTKQVETLNDEIVRLQRRLESVEADNRRMMQVGAFLITTAAHTRLTNLLTKLPPLSPRRPFRRTRTPYGKLTPC